jgi:outer membrane receptor protein involved in Fe transport
MKALKRVPLHAAIAAVLAAAAGTASAQETGAKQAALEEITVTGSRIRRQDQDGVGPVAVLTAEDIAVTGVTSTEVLLQRMSISAGFAGNQTNAYWTSGGWGTAQVNLRGLGSNRTLVLLNGRRVVYGGTGANSAVDLNMIPTSLIERIEVLKDGASALYGADAVAGVVNIVTKSEFEGLDLEAKYGTTDRGDGTEISASATFGVTNDAGSLMAALSYSDFDEINMADRQACALAISGNKLVCSGSASTSGGRATFLTGPDRGKRINFNQVPGGNGDFYEPYVPAVHNIPYFQWLNAVNPIENTSVALFGDYKVADNTKFFTEVTFTNRQSSQIATPATLQSYYVPGVGVSNFNIPASHPTNPTGQDIRLDRRRLVETGVRDTFQETDTWRVVVGLEGRIRDNWNWDIAFNKGRNTGIDGSTNVANLQRVYETMFNCNGTTVPCADYLGVGDITQEAIDYIMFVRRDTGGNEQTSLTANITGFLFDLPAGKLGFAAGAESRKDKGWRDPDPLVVASIANTNQQSPISGEIKANELYAEFSVPLLRDLPMVKSLEANLAARYSDYDLFGDDTNYKAGLLWTVVDGLKLRATSSTAFRVPNVPELFGGVSEAQLTTADPCSGWSTKSPTSDIYKNCQAAGVPVGYTQIGNVIRTTVGGNSDLQPESADTLTIGLVWQPSFLSGLQATIDYWDIQISDSIQSIPGSQKLSQCYNSVGLSHPFCAPQHHTRDSLTGEVNFLSAQPSNIGSEDASGIDLGITFDTDIRSYAAVFDVTVSYLDTYEVSAFPGAVPIDYAGYITGGRGSYTHWRGNASATVSGALWTANWNMQYIGAADDINVPSGIGSSVDAVMYHNLQFAYSITDDVRLAVGVDNIFDEDAPFYASWIDANTDTMTYDLMGTRYYLRVNWARGK